MYVTHPAFMLNHLVWPRELETGGLEMVSGNTHLQIIGPNMDLWPDRFLRDGFMSMPAVFRYEAGAERAVERILTELDEVIQGKRQEAKKLRESDAPPAAIVEVENEIDLLTRQFLTLVDHTRSIT